MFWGNDKENRSGKELYCSFCGKSRAGTIELIERMCPLVYQTSADHDMIYQAVLNLLSNAVKYTPAGGEISIVLESQNGDAQIIVEDTGIGIPAEDQPRRSPLA